MSRREMLGDPRETDPVASQKKNDLFAEIIRVLGLFLSLDIYPHDLP